MNRILLPAFAMAAVLFGAPSPGHADTAMKPATTSSLNPAQQSIVTIAAFTAGGDLPQLTVALHEGLDAGLTISEIKEVLVQMYAYAGFPRSLNGLGAFMAVLDERAKQGKTDAPGREPSPLPTDRGSLEFGTENQTRLIGAPVKGPLFTFAPVIDQFLKAHLFGDIFARDVLDYKTREIATIAALANLDGVDSQLQSHLRIGLHTGLSEAQIKSMIAVLAEKVGRPQADNIARLLAQVLNQEPPPPAVQKVRLAKLEIHPAHLAAYNAALAEEIADSIRLEPGVLALRAVAEKENPTRITIMEIYADETAYAAHIASPHFQKYKTGTAHMVKSLELAEVAPILLGEK